MADPTPAEKDAMALAVSSSRHHWHGFQFGREYKRVETETGKVVAVISRQSCGSDWYWNSDTYIDESSVRRAVEKVFP